MHMLFAGKLEVAQSVLVLLFLMLVPCLQARSRFNWIAVLVILHAVLSRRRLPYTCLQGTSDCHSKNFLIVCCSCVCQLSPLTQKMVRCLKSGEGWICCVCE